MKLMIVESPNKTKKITEILGQIRPGENWKVAASVGHIRDLPASGETEGEITTGVRADLMPRYELTDKGKDVVSRLKALAEKADEIYLATDPDREGESISWHLQQALKLKNPIRVSFNEITEGRIRSAIENPTRIDMKLVGAQEARRVLDRLVGYLVSPALFKLTGDRLSAGRVQSPAVYLVVVREREIAAFKVTVHYGAQLIFADAKTGGQWAVEWMTAEGFTSDDNPYFMDGRYAGLVAGVRDVSVLSCEEKDASRNPPGPFTTSTLQQAASNALKWNPKKTMDLAQELFAQGHISYHRTDNPNVADESMPDIRAVAAALGLEVVDKRRAFKAGEGAQAGHPGITPTHWEIEVAGETPDQQTLYKLIRTRAIASQLLAARYKDRTVIMRATEPVEGKTVTFGAVGRTLVSPGWLKLLGKDATEDDDEDAEPNNPIPLLTPGQTLKALDGKVLEKKTRPPKRYTEASLVKALEVKGIGRPSTSASIMNNIIEIRGYVEVDSKRQLRPTPLGEKLIACLEGKFSFLDLGFTRELETDLDKIAEGKAQYRGVVERLHASLGSELGQLSSMPSMRKEHPCPDCGKPMHRRKGSSGHFWGCTGYPDCSTTLPDEKGEPGKPKVVALSNYPCGKCGKPLVHKQKKGKGGYDFWGCSGFKEGCRASYPNLKGNKPDMANGK